jgi:hypothetical protein
MPKTYEEEFGPLEEDQPEDRPERVKPCLRRIEMVKDGPLLVYGMVSIIFEEGGQPLDPDRPLALCRCGLSENKPFCDGKHESRLRPLFQSLPAGEIE